MNERTSVARVPSITVVSGLLLVRSEGVDKMLMTLRKPTARRPNMWEHPGGKVEANERLQDGLVREWKEELGVTIEPGPLIAQSLLCVEVTLNVHLFAVTLVEGDPKPLDAADIGLFDPMYAIQHMACTPATYLYWPRLWDYVRQVGHVA